MTVINLWEASRILNSEMHEDIQTLSAGSIRAAAHYLKAKAVEQVIPATGIHQDTNTRIEIPQLEWVDLMLNPATGEAHVVPNERAIQPTQGDSVTYKHLRWNEEDIWAVHDWYHRWLVMSLTAQLGRKSYMEAFYAGTSGLPKTKES